MSWNIKTPGDYINGPLTVVGDVTIGSNAFKIDSVNKRVGVNTATTSTGGGQMVVEHANNNGLVINSTGGSPTIYLRNTADANPAKLFFSDNGLTFANVTNGTLMTLNSTGLGVGTTVQYARLTVSGSNSTGIANIQNSAFASNALGTLSCYIGHDATANRPFIQAATGNAGNAFDLLIQPYGGNVGIGINPDRKLHVGSTVYPQLRLVYTGVNTYDIGVTSGGVLALNHTSTTNGLVLNSSGNVAIGGTAQAWNTSYKGVQVGLGANFYTNAGTPNNGWFATNTYQDASNQTTFIGTGYGLHYRHLFGEHAWLTSTVSGSAGVAATMNQLMTLDSGGKLILGTTGAYNAARLTVQSAGGAGGINTSIQNDNDSYYAINFRNSSGVSCGSISCLTSSTAFNTSSDYRLKEAVQPIICALSRVSALKPSIYKWKVDGSSGEGFLAHELAEVVPFAVTGEKDATNADGSIKPQGVDLSKVVPVLVAAIQELTARVVTLENA